MEAELKDGRIDVDQPLWDQSTFYGRLRHFFWMTDYRTVIVPTQKLLDAEELVQKYRNGIEPDGTTNEEVKYALKLYRSAFHPDSGELQNLIGRMSFQVPGGMIITAGMMQFYKTNGSVILWQWINQSFNALVNYTNRNAASTITTTQMGVAYASATTCAVVTALSLKSFLSTRASPFLQRYVPFAALVAANMVNLPLSRQTELQEGIGVFDEYGNRITESRYAAVKGISQVVFSRCVMAAPGMLTMPFIMDFLEKKRWFGSRPWLHLPFQTLMVGCFLTFMTPTACSLFPQKCSMNTESLKIMDSARYEEAKARFGDNLPETLYFNKGL